LGRGVAAIKQNNGSVFVSWRLLGTDKEDLAFNLYRTTGGKNVKLNGKPLTGATNFVDTDAKGDRATAYFVRPVESGREQKASTPFRMAAGAPARPYVSIPLK
ncbi:MAG: hypothetical protein V4671_33775, partial [Armatimonadota bacterium]